MPKLADLYGVDLNRLGKYRPEYTSVMETAPTDFEMEQRRAPIDQEYASGRLEAPMFSPDDLIGSGVFTKLASLAKGLSPALVAGIIKNKGGVWGRGGIPGWAEDILKNPGSDPKAYTVLNTVSYPVQYPSPDSIRAALDGKTAQELYGLSTQSGLAHEYKSFEDIANLKPGYLADFKQRLVAKMANEHLANRSKFPEMASNPEVAVKLWERGPLVNYIRNRMGTIDDPIRELAEQGITHLSGISLRRAISIPRIAEHRAAFGFPEEDVAKTPLGKTWERIADKNIRGGGLDEYGNQRYFLDEAPYHSPRLFDLSEYVRRGIVGGTISPHAASRGNFSVSDAVKGMHNENLARNDVYKNATTFKEYPETGHKWVRLDKRGQFSREADFMNHCIGGYECSSSQADIKSGRTEIYSLRNRTGKPSVTLQILNETPDNPKITQIRGRGNREELSPENEAMVQDFARTRGATIASR